MSDKQNKRKVIIRLYRQFDIDLIYAFQKLKKQGIVLQDWIVGILRSYIDGTYFPGRTTPTTSILFDNEEGGKIVLSRKLIFHINLDETDDEDILNWLEGITIGYRNTVIKGIVRGYIGRPCIYPCLTTTDLYFKGTDSEQIVKLANDGLRGGQIHE